MPLVQALSLLSAHRGRLLTVAVVHIPITLVVVLLLPLFLICLPVMPARYANVVSEILRLLKEWSCACASTQRDGGAGGDV
jgi:hypothetical protein